MQLLIPNSIQLKLLNCLERAATLETGGVLMGSLEGNECIRVTHITSQESLGTSVEFARIGETNSLKSLV